MTDKMRKLYGALFAIVVLAGLIGWLAGKDPGQLTGLLGAVTLAAGIGEASNVGKRATFKPEAM
jgi:hypothetical protein